MDTAGEMTVTVPQAVFLLALDDETGRPLVDRSALAQVLSAAGLVELIMLGRLRIAGQAGAESGVDADAKPGTFVAVGQPLDPAGADADLEALVETAVGRKPDSAVKLIVGFGGPKSEATKLREGIAEEFVDAGVLGHEEKKFLGGTFSERWPRGENAQLEDSIQAEARALLTGDADPREADRVAAALALLHAVRALPRVFPDLDRASISKRAEELVDAAAVAGELGAMIREAQLVMLATVSTLVITTRD
ncbi:hypothetical protein C5B85_15325 [Pseudoclavibacter sp. AY1F1]|uniref:GOLPH3/VPS74 family protein n=1 Tax=Pseudoclavibacter sp. AY1F1 TaxID=2080583 RepID=UPI000CE84A5A|nr:GPP34 family phosphoprotein [Pseudoclavibacter sp. AY1F1]PPF42650.1 hypothetical protein C5B85_15325 [Pseudoclavibacter sp. AY1F1]